MADFALNAVSPVDGRYAGHTAPLIKYFSEAALLKYRVFVEVEYLIALAEIPLPQMIDFPKEGRIILRDIIEKFSDNDAFRLKAIEKEINHDVKAVEYFLKEKISGTALEKWSEFVHFGLTSQDINNTAVPLGLKDALNNEILPALNKVIAKLSQRAEELAEVPMLAFTHGQPASPSKLGKEIFVFVERLNRQKDLLNKIPHSGKFGGATGNFNAHLAAYPGINWIEFGNDFLKEKLGLQRQQVTTQIEHYDYMAAIFHAFIRINNILLDLNRDIWTYISMNYFTQKIKKGEVGSSAMPHKVNPIDFENSEGNLGVANAMFQHLAAKLPVSRLQRDLTDSTVTRNIGVPFAHSIIAYASLIRGLEKIEVNREQINIELENNWAVLAEAVQTILRREGVENPYEKLKELTRSNEKISKKVIRDFIQTLEVDEKVKEELLKLSPKNYTGYNHQEMKGEEK